MTIGTHYIKEQDMYVMKKKVPTDCSVYVGGDEVNDYKMHIDDAKDLALEYIEDGYDDVVIYQEIDYMLINNKWEQV